MSTAAVRALLSVIVRRAIAIIVLASAFEYGAGNSKASSGDPQAAPSQSSNLCSSAKASELAREMVSLARRSLSAGLPDELPPDVKATVQRHVVEDFESGAWNYDGRGFIDYHFLRRHAPELYRDLRNFWHHSDRSLLGAIRCLDIPFSSESDPRVRALVAQGVLSILYEAHDRDDAQRVAVLQLLEATTERTGVVALIRAHELVRIGSPRDAMNLADSERRLKTLLDRDQKDCYLIEWYLREIQGAHGPVDDVAWADYLLELTNREFCVDEYRLNVIGKIEKDFSDPYGAFRPLVYRWLDEGLAAGGGPLVERIFSQWALQETERESLLPYLIRALDSPLPSTRANAVDGLAIATEAQRDSLPYDHFVASYPPSGQRGDRSVKPPRPLSPAEEWEQFDRELAKAVWYWKTWWTTRSRQERE